MSIDIKDLAGTRFPDNVLQGLKKLDEALRVPSSPHIHKLQQLIIDDHIFSWHESSIPSKIVERGPIEELVIVRSLAQYLAQIIDPATRNILFLALFPTFSNGHRMVVRFRILTSLISLSIATHNVAVMDSSAVWMQQMNCLSTQCGQVCHSFASDFCHRRSEGSPTHFNTALRSLPEATPLFTANLVTTLTQIYAKIRTNEVCSRPPDELVSLFVAWIKSTQHLLLMPLMTSLPGITVPMLGVCPIIPLAKCCIEAPFFILHSSDQYVNTPDEFNSPSHLIYSELHMLLLEALQGLQLLKHRVTQREVFGAVDVKFLAESLNVRINSTEVSEKSRMASDVALDRLAQLVLVAMHAGAIAGRMNEMWASLKKLPSTRLMSILMAMSS